MTENRTFEPSIAVFCDYENVAIGAREARFDGFQIELVLERLLDKGKVVVKKAYSDWDRYKANKRELHEAAFELIEIPHVSYSGKNSADIRLVVDALDLCYTESHVDIFAIISGDSDFSPLVSKLRENDKRVIGLGVKNSSSDLLIDNCDEFIFYDDLVRQRPSPKQGGKPGQEKSNSRGAPKPRGGASSASVVNAGASSSSPNPAASAGAASANPSSTNGANALTTTTATSNAAAPLATATSSGVGSSPTAGAPAPAPARREVDEVELERRRVQALDYVLDTVESLFRDREDNVWGSMVKQTLKRKRPSFSESYHGFRSFSELLEAAKTRGLLELQKDERSGGYLITAFGPNA